MHASPGQGTSLGSEDQILGRPDAGDELIVLGSAVVFFLPWKVVAVLVWTYLVGLIALWIAQSFAGDRWWFATVLTASCDAVQPLRLRSVRASVFHW